MEPAPKKQQTRCLGNGVILREPSKCSCHWVASGLLFLIGCKMIYEGVRQGSALEAKPLTIYVLLILSTATSIDALAVGLSLTFLKVQIAAPNKIDWQ